MKKFMSLFLSVTIVFVTSLLSYAYAEESEMKESEIDQDTAVTVGMIFVANATPAMRWNDNTQIEQVIPLYDSTDSVAYYYIGLNTDNEQTGYVVVSANMEEPLIAEFSDDEDLPVEYDMWLRKKHVPLREVKDGEKIYYSLSGCSNKAIESNETFCSSITPDMRDEFYSIAFSMVEGIKEQGIVLVNAKSGNYINNPVTYINENYSGYTYSLTASHTVSGTFPGYVMSGNNSCVEHGTAALLKYYLGSTYTYDTIANQCKSIAVTNGYATTNNYYIPTGLTKTFVQDCFYYYGFSKIASSTPVLSAAITEINNNRPCLLNILTCPQYYDHAVSAFGYSMYILTRTSDGHSISLTFYKIKDAFSFGDRYVCNSTMTGVYVTRVQ